MATLPTTLTNLDGYSFMDVETMGGDELRSLTVADLGMLLAEGVELLANEEASQADRKGRDLRISRSQCERARKVIGRLHYYIGAAAGLESLMTERGYSGE